MVAELPEKAVQAAVWAAWISDPAFRERQNPAKRPGFCLGDRGAMRIDTDATPKSGLRILRDGVLLNVLNPKLSIFFVAFLPQFIVADAPQPFIRMLELSAVFMTMTFIVFATYGIFAALMRDRVIAKPHIMERLRRAFAAAFVALGVKLALQE